jgi:hypothetical protein
MKPQESQAALLSVYRIGTDCPLWLAPAGPFNLSFFIAFACPSFVAKIETHVIDTYRYITCSQILAFVSIKRWHRKELQFHSQSYGLLKSDGSFLNLNMVSCSNPFSTKQ